MIEKEAYKFGALGFIVALTVGIHYGWLLEPIFGSSHWIHAIHGRFCYIPIVMGAAWFGFRGGLITAAVVSALVLPYVLFSDLTNHTLAGETVEIVFYFAIASLVGALVDREMFARRKRAEMRLELERSQRLSLVGQMAAGVAHEIKNPLASIKGAVEIIGDQSASEADRSQFKDIVVSEIHRIDGTVTDFLTFARPQKSKMEKIDLSSTVRDTLTQLESQVAKSGMSLKRSIDPEVYIRGDKSKIHQMTLNLILNSIEASQAGSAIDVQLTQNGSDIAHLVISDEGSGLPQDDIEKVFEPFYTTKSTGTGLGLAIVRSIVEELRGSISIKSVPAGGASVEIELPTYGG